MVPSFHLIADVSSDAPDRIREVVVQLFPTGVTETPQGFHIEAVLEGDSARDLNRTVLSALRRAEKRTRTPRRLDLRRHDGAVLRLRVQGQPTRRLTSAQPAGAGSLLSSISQA